MACLHQQDCVSAKARGGSWKCERQDKGRVVEVTEMFSMTVPHGCIHVQARGLAFVKCHCLYAALQNMFLAAYLSCQGKKRACLGFVERRRGT